MARVVESSVAALCREVLAREGELWFRIDGHSMRPLLRSGDRVLIRPCSIEALTGGDLVLLDVGNSLCLHRVIMSAGWCGTGRVNTKGDACGRWDLPVAADSVIGKGIAIRRGPLMLALDGMAGRFLGYAGVCVSLLLGWGLWMKWRLLS